MIKIEHKVLGDLAQITLSHETEEKLNKFEMFLGHDEIYELIERLQDIRYSNDWNPEFYVADSFDIRCRETKEEILEMINSECIFPSDGDGFWGTETHVSDLNVFKQPPDWATHGYWYNK